MRLALADILHLGRVERVNLRPALALGLVPHLPGQRQHALQHDPTEQVGVATKFAADVADDAAEIGFELL